VPYHVCFVASTAKKCAGGTVGTDGSSLPCSVLEKTVRTRAISSDAPKYCAKVTGPSRDQWHLEAMRHDLLHSTREEGMACALNRPSETTRLHRGPENK